MSWNELEGVLSTFRLFLFVATLSSLSSLPFCNTAPLCFWAVVERREVWKSPKTKKKRWKNDCQILGETFLKQWKRKTSNEKNPWKNWRKRNLKTRGKTKKTTWKKAEKTNLRRDKEGEKLGKAEKWRQEKTPDLKS